MFDNSLKILFAEDITTDFELAERTLKKGGINFIPHVVETKESFFNALKDFKPDIVISDYSMPNFDGMKALKLTKKFDPTIPFIVLTGSMNEETAVQCMKEGANDYVIKELISRLPYAVNEALQNRNILIEKKRVEKELKEKTEELDNYFTNALDLFCIASIDGIFLRLNKSWETTLGYKLDELMGQPYLNFIHHEDIAPTVEAMTKLSHNEEIKSFVNRYKCKNGTYKWIEWRAVTRGEKVYGAARDISDRKKYETEIFELSERLQHYLATSQTITYALQIKKDESFPFWVSENITRILGYEISEALENNWWINNIYPDDKNKIEENITEMKLKETESLIQEYRFFKKDKNIVWIRDELRLIRDKNGVPYEIVGTWTDISKRKKVEEELIKSEEKYRKFFEEDLSGIYLSTPEGELLDCNPAFVTTFGFKNKEEALNTNTKDLFADPGHRKNFISLLNERKAIVYYEQKYLKRNREEIYVIENAIGIFGTNGELKKIQGYLFDITEIKNLQNELLNAKEAAERADYLKTEFLAQMSHEIRTPINAILNAANLIKEETYGYMNNEAKDFFPVIDSASKRIIRTIDSILNMSELQIGSYAPHYKRIDVEKEIIEKLYFEFKSLTISKGFRFDVICETEDVLIVADAYSMEQIFTNLIDNAIKYTEKGSIEIRIYRNHLYKLCVDITDTGIGISKEFLPMLFEPFRQEQQGYTRRFEGNGLGLALVKNYCKINNAEISVQSEKGFGTTFTVTFAEE